VYKLRDRTAINPMQTTAEYTCAFCGESNSTFVDFSAGLEQSYSEDCQVCCRPNILYVRIDEDTLEIEIETDYQE
jgi:Cysteine-rich CPXCG